MSKQMDTDIITEAKPHTIKDMSMNGLEKFSVIMGKTVVMAQKESSILIACAIVGFIVIR